MIWVLLSVLWLLALLFALGLCRAAKEGDRKLAEWRRTEIRAALHEGGNDG